MALFLPTIGTGGEGLRLIILRLVPFFGRRVFTRRQAWDTVPRKDGKGPYPRNASRVFSVRLIGYLRLMNFDLSLFIQTDLE